MSTCASCGINLTVMNRSIGSDTCSGCARGTSPMARLQAAYSLFQRHPALTEESLVGRSLMASTPYLLVGLMVAIVVDLIFLAVWMAVVAKGGPFAAVIGLGLSQWVTGALLTRIAQPLDVARWPAFLSTVIVVVAAGMVLDIVVDGAVVVCGVAAIFAAFGIVAATDLKRRETLRAQFRAYDAGRNARQAQQRLEELQSAHGRVLHAAPPQPAAAPVQPVTETRPAAPIQPMARPAAAPVGGSYTLAPGTVIGADYQIVRPLSAGGMGAVYVALQRSTGRERALKVMLGEIASNPDLRRRFVQEARIGAQIDSEHVVEVVGAGIDEPTGTPWLAMELLEGEDLASYLKRCGPIAPAQAVDLLVQLAHAIGSAHDRGVVHRDLKPENIFLAKARRAGTPFSVKVLDFGIAKLTGQVRTSATGAMGTPLWMSPEQTQSGSNITPAADVWALGLIVFRMLCGRFYWKAGQDDSASSMMVLREVVMEPLVPASQRARELGGAAVPPGFDAWFAACVERDPVRRFPSGRPLFEALLPILRSAHGAPTGTIAAAPLTSVGALTPTEPRHAVAAPGRPTRSSAPMVVVPITPATPASTQSNRTALIVAGCALVPVIAVGAALLGPTRSSSKKAEPDASQPIATTPAALAASAPPLVSSQEPTSSLPDSGPVSCEAAQLRYREDHESAGTLAMVSSGEAAKTLNNSAYLSNCGVPGSMSVVVCTAIQEGVPVGVTVRTTPSNPTIASCIRTAILGLRFPRRPSLDVTTTTFAATPGGRATPSPAPTPPPRPTYSPNGI